MLPALLIVTTIVSVAFAPEARLAIVPCTLCPLLLALIPLPLTLCTLRPVGTTSVTLTLLAALGPEPLSPQFNADYLYEKLRKQKRAAKLALMDNAVVVGVGNIYANECLFKAGVSPMRAANQITRQECGLLVETIQAVLQRAIATGGSTLRDFVNSDGKSGYFQQEYTVYGRENQPCLQCGDLIHKAVIGQLGPFYSHRCQK